MCLTDADEDSEWVEQRVDPDFDPAGRAETLVQLHLGTRVISEAVAMEITERIFERERRMEVRTKVAERLEELLKKP